MDGFKANEAVPIPNYKDVFKELDEERIYSYYIPNLEFNTSILSPLGDPDTRPSFSVFWSYRKLKYLFKEHRYGWTGDVVDFVRLYFNYRDNTKACMRILHDFGVEGYKIDDDILFTSPTFIGGQIKVAKKRARNVKLDVTIRDWEPHDLNFWGKWGYNEKWLKFTDIYPIKYYFFNGNAVLADRFAYVYVERKDGEITYKIYQPFNTKQRKWMSNNNSSVWELWSKLPKTHDKLIITKSRKDAGSIMATAGIPATALQAEGTIPKNHVVDELKSRFKRIWLFYDNDYDSDRNYGQEYAMKLSETFEIPNIVIPSDMKSKDYTDFIVKYSIDNAVEMLNYLIENEI